MDSAANGDEAAYERLFQRYLPQLQAFVAFHMGDGLALHESSADIVQSACREVLRDLHSFEYRGEMAFKQLLFLSARRKLVDRARHHRRQRRDRALDCELHDQVATGVASLLTPSRVAMGREHRERLMAALEQLPAPHRQVLMLCRGLGMTPSEAAAELGQTANQVRVTLHRALARLSTLRRRLGS